MGRRLTDAHSGDTCIPVYFLVPIRGCGAFGNPRLDISECYGTEKRGVCGRAGVSDVPYQSVCR